jgi:hypothetical protein
VTLNANYNNSLNAERIEIKEVRTNTIVKTCYNATSCTVTVYPYQNGYSSTQYSASVVVSERSLVTMQYSPVIYFDGSSQTGTLTLTADRTSITSGQSVMLSASYNNSLNGGRIEIKEVSSSNIVKACYDTTYCSVTVYPNQNASTQYVATVFNNSGSIVATQYGPTIYINGNNNGSSNDGANYINGLTLQSDRTSAANGGMVKLTANAYNAGNWSYVGNRIEIRDIRTGSTVRSCYDQSWCVADVVRSRAYNGTAQYEARIYDRNGQLRHEPVWSGDLRERGPPQARQAHPITDCGSLNAYTADRTSDLKWPGRYHLPPTTRDRFLPTVVASRSVQAMRRLGRNTLSRPATAQPVLQYTVHRWYKRLLQRDDSSTFACEYER